MNKLVACTVLAFCILLSGCMKQVENKEIEDDYIDNYPLSQTSLTKKDSRFPIPYSKLETFLGLNFIPVYFELTNVDLDIEEEIVVAHKNKSSSSLKITFFDIFPKEVLKKKVEFDTEIFETKNFNFQNHNLFYEDDISILFEGKSSDNKTLLYIYTYDDENDSYILIRQFTGDYSIISDYEEVEDKETKFVRLKEITTIDNTFTSTNTHIQQKSVYIWDYDEEVFTLAETSEILAPLSEIDKSVLNSDNFLQFIDGFWYPEKYKKYITKNSKDLSGFSSNNIEFIRFSSDTEQVIIKHDDYLQIFSIVKINRLWGQKPGIRIKIKSDSEKTKFTKRYIEIFLMDDERLYVKGPEKFEVANYYRFPRPFIEYVEDKNKELSDSKLDAINKFLTGSFYSDNNIILTFNGDNTISIRSDDVLEKASYSLKKYNNGYLFTFLMDSSKIFNDVLMYNITVLEDANSFSLISVNINLDGFSVENLKSLKFKKDIHNED